jgi:branched-chain amino acid transport system substrate-binding protein
MRLACCLVALLSLAAWPAAAQIKIAVAGPMSGANASFGAQLREGAEQAVADINAKGGILGQQLVLDVQDDACDPRQAVSVANAIAEHGDVFVAGHFCSSSSIPASKVYTEEGILQISPASTNPAYTDQGGWNTFRICGRDDQQGKVAGTYIAQHYKGKKVAILNDNSAYGHGLAEETRKAMNAAGMQEAMFQAYVPGDRDYSALVSRMKEAGINVIYLGGYQTEAGLILRQAKEQGMDVVLIGGDALVTNEFWGITGPAGNGTLMTFAADPRKLPQAKAVVDEFAAKKIDPEGYVLYSYAAVQAWAEAATKAGTTDAQKVAAALKANHEGWDTVLGPIAFDAKGDVTQSNYVFYVWKDGGYSQM